jgi:uncharacterized membrane protein
MPRQRTIRHMLVMSRFWLTAAAVLFASAAGAQNAVERDVKAAPGKDARVAVYTDIRPDCTSGPLPAIRLATPPAHGAVTIKRGTLKVTNYKQCLATEVPVFVAFYRAADNFNGPDEFVLEVSMTGGRKQLQHFRVSVSATPGSGQGI